MEPDKPTDPETPAAAQPQRRPAAGAPRGNGEHVLCVDDDEAIIYVTTRVLERLGYRVSGFLNAVEALEAFKARPDDFDAIVTDLSMPSMSGPELALEMRQIRPGIPLVLTSGCIRPEDAEVARSLGLSELIPKPSTVEEMGEILSRLLSNRRRSAASGEGTGAPPAGR